MRLASKRLFLPSAFSGGVPAGWEWHHPFGFLALPDPIRLGFG